MADAVVVNIVGLGTDVVEIPRFRTVLARTPRLAQRVFTESERALAAERSDGVPTLAARFAVKEAVMKALGVGIGEVAFADIEVTPATDGPPQVLVSGRAAARAHRLGVRTWWCSLSHADTVAVATVLAVGP